jgi:ABC-type multidrug transport system ATPase subunit
MTRNLEDSQNVRSGYASSTGNGEETMRDELGIHTERLGKSYGDVEAVKGLDLSIRPHRITAFLGLNGAGKSTTIKMLLGMIRSTSGGRYNLRGPDQRPG